MSEEVETEQQEPSAPPVKYICVFCRTGKPNGIYSQCNNCGSYLGEPVNRWEIFDKRRPFSDDNRRADPL